MTYNALRGYSRGGRAYGAMFDPSEVGNVPDLIAALAPTINNLTGPGGPVSEEQLNRERGLVGEAIMGETASIDRERTRMAGRGGYSRDVAVKTGERDRQRQGQKYRGESEMVEARFADKRQQLSMMVGDAAAGTAVAQAGINQREKEEAERRSWYEKFINEEKSRRNRRALLGLGGALVGGIAGGMLGGESEGAETGPQGAGSETSPNGSSPFSMPPGVNPNGLGQSFPNFQIADVAESMMPNLSMQSIGIQHQTMNTMMRWSRILQGSQLGMSLMQGFDF